MVDDSKPSREEMIEFLSSHFCYFTMNSWNRSTSYARNVKVYNPGISREQLDNAYELLEAEGTFDVINELMTDFNKKHHHEYRMAFNGRSGGYVVMIKGGSRPSGYQSYCPVCGQKNYTRVVLPDTSPEGIVRNYVRTHDAWVEGVYPRQPEIAGLGLPNDEVLRLVREVKQELSSGIRYSEDNVCGRCGSPGRVNFDKPDMKIYIQPGMSIDAEKDFEDWDDYSLQSRYNLVKDFDATIDECVSEFKALVASCKAVEKTIMVPKTIRVLKCVGASA